MAIQYQQETTKPTFPIRSLIVGIVLGCAVMFAQTYMIVHSAALREILFNEYNRYSTAFWALDIIRSTIIAVLVLIMLRMRMRPGVFWPFPVVSLSTTIVPSIGFECFLLYVVHHYIGRSYEWGDFIWECFVASIVGSILSLIFIRPEKAI